MSIGNQTQAVDFDKENLTLVLGANLDLGGDDSGSRNGTGKTTMINALSYALYGQALTNIRKENLINKTNGKGMLVTVEFESAGINYKIERGRKPNVLRFYANNQELRSNEEVEDDSQGDSRETQKYIEQLLAMSHTMFKHLVALNTYTEPFLSMKSGDQREIIEQLLGITALSEKAETLKTAMKATKDSIQAETFRIEGIKAANDNVQRSIDSLEIKSSAWINRQQTDLENLSKAILELEAVDIETELATHQQWKTFNENNNTKRELEKQRSTLDSAVIQAEKSLQRFKKELLSLSEKRCHSCDQQLQDHKHQELTDAAVVHLADAETYYQKVSNDLSVVKQALAEIQSIPQPPGTFYETENEAMGHKNNLQNLEQSLKSRLEEINPYEEQIVELKKTALQAIEWNTVNDLTKLRDHQEFLHKLLTNKDSFIRKKIIDQNLSYLNKRLTYYIDRMGLPHTVTFVNDLTVEITQYGQDLDFDNLSRGERNRLILSLSWAFRDVWENLYQHINLLFVDELIDAGMDAAGVEAGLSVLKKMGRERGKNIFLISHKDELVGRVNTVLRVIKEAGFTSYESNPEFVES